MSGILRQRIGQEVSRLTKYIAAANELLDDLSLPEAATDVTVAHHTKISTKLLDNVRRTVSVIERLDDEWRTYQFNNEAEQAIYTEYIEKYGEYLPTLDKGREIIDALDIFNDGWSIELHKRLVNLENSSMSSHTPPDHDITYLTAYERRNRTGTTTPAILKDAAGTHEVQRLPRSTLTHTESDPTQPTALHPYTTLPRIKLPQFSGDITQWPTFIELFRGLVDTLPISSTIKFHHLRSSLRRDAYRVVSGLALTDTNYTVALDLLEKTFGKQNSILHALRSKFLQFQVRGTTAEHLSKSLRYITSIYEQLTSLGEDMDTTTHAQLIETRFPSWIMKKVLTRLHGKNPTTKTLLTTLSDILDIQEYVDRVNTDNHFTPNSYSSSRSPSNSYSSHHNAFNPQQIQNHQKQRNFHNPNINTSSSTRENNAHNLHTTFPIDNTHTFSTQHTLVSPPTFETVHPTKDNTFVFNTQTKTRKCFFCQSLQHNLFNCPKTSLERFEIVSERKACRNCLSLQHTVNNCTNSHRCKNCQHKHHTSLCKNPNTSHSENRSTGIYNNPPHNNDRPINQRKQNNAQSFKQPTQPTATTHLAHNDVGPANTYTTLTYTPQLDATPFDAKNMQMSTFAENNLDSNISADPNAMKEVLLLCLDVTISHPSYPDDKHVITAFLDSGSTRSYIHKELADQLNLPHFGTQELQLTTFGSTQSRPFITDQLSVLLHTKYEPIEMIISTMPDRIAPMKSISFPAADITKFSKKLSLPSAHVQPQILIGGDYFWDIFAGHTTTPLPSGFTLINTILGSVISGRGKLKSLQTSLLANAFSVIEDSTDNNQPQHNLETFWNLELMGITDNPHSKDDDVCMELFSSTIQRIGQRYRVKWPFKEPHPSLPSNYGLAYQRLKKVLQSLQKNPELLQQYNEIFKEQEKLNIIESIDNHTLQHSLKHYLPHHPVFTPQKTTKIRIVYDASAKMARHKSLNECLYRGPVLLPDLIGILLRFRLAPIILIANIEKAFLQIELDFPDRDVTRFLWVKDIDKPLEPENIKMYRFVRVPFGIISSPFLLSATILHHLKISKYPLATELLQNLYVDNAMLTAHSLNEAKQKYTSSKQIFTEASMNLREFTSNNNDFKQYIKQLGDTPQNTTKLLGIHWNTDSDTLKFSLPTFDNPTITKRTILQFVAKLFDPLGLLCPLVVPLKLLLQNLWTQKLTWDDPIPQPYNTQWITLCDTWKDLENFTFPRSLSLDNKQPVELHCFVDASQKAYGACIYLKHTTTQNTTATQLIFAKSRLAPISKKNMTIPKMELMATVIGTRLIQFVHKHLALQISQSYLWSDSTCVLNWIQSTKDLPVFIKNRITEITECTIPINYRYVSTNQNPADIISRGCTPSELHSNSLWFQGPCFLSLPFYNERKDTILSFKESIMLISDNLTHNHPLPISTTNVSQHSHKHESILPMVSSFIKLRIILSMILYFITKQMWSKKSQQLFLSKTLSSTNSIVPKTFYDFRKQYTKHIDTYLFWLAQKTYPPTPMLKQKFNFFQDNDGLWKLRTRLNKIRPESLIYLPPTSYITKLYITYIHQCHGHAPYSTVLAKLRINFWLPKGRRVVRSVIYSCSHCKKRYSKPFALPEMPSLPMSRLTPSRPFSHIGLDYLGPLQYKLSEGTIGKLWVSLFTCFASRAIHCEWTTSLSTISFLQTFRRFIARRGMPTTIVSDNATQFKLASSIFEGQSFPSMDLSTIQWKFITELAPWQGGIYERMCGLFKEALKATVGKRLLSFEELLTLIAEAEITVNSRSLTYIPADPTFTPIRPIDILIPGIGKDPVILESHPDFNPHDRDYTERISTSFSVECLLQESLKLRDQFWNRWNSHYLPNMEDTLALHHRSPRSVFPKPPQIGDIVLLKDDDIPKHLWKLAKIIDLSSDSNPHSAKIMLANRKILNRAINYLYPLELQTTSIPPETQKDQPQQLRRSNRIKNMPIKTYVYFITIFTILCLPAIIAKPQVQQIVKVDSAPPGPPPRWGNRTAANQRNSKPIEKRLIYDIDKINGTYINCFFLELSRKNNSLLYHYLNDSVKLT